MSKKKKEVKYIMNWESQKVYKQETISSKFVKFLKEEEVAALISEQDTQLGIISERNSIDWIDPKENNELWEDSVQQHICEKILIDDDDDHFVRCEYNEFKGNYFYVASLWQLHNKKNLIILEHYH